MRILVDIDDTIENLLDAWVAYLNRKFHTNVKVEDCKEWDMKALFPMLREEDIYGALQDEELWKSVKPKYDAIFYLQRFQEEGYEIVLVTTSFKYNIQLKYEIHLQKYFSFIKDIVVTNHKQLVKGDWLVDDFIENLEGGDYEKILFTAQHNKCLDTSSYKDVIRCNDWEEVYKTITGGNI